MSAKPCIQQLLRFSRWQQQNIKQNVGPSKFGAQCDLHRLHGHEASPSGEKWKVNLCTTRGWKMQRARHRKPTFTGGTIVEFSFGDSGVKTEFFWVSGRDEIVICHCTIKVLAL